MTMKEGERRKEDLRRSEECPMKLILGARFDGK